MALTLKQIGAEKSWSAKKEDEKAQTAPTVAQDQKRWSSGTLTLTQKAKQNPTTSPVKREGGADGASTTASGKSDIEQRMKQAGATMQTANQRITGYSRAGNMGKALEEEREKLKAAQAEYDSLKQQLALLQQNEALAKRAQEFAAGNETYNALTQQDDFTAYSSAGATKDNSGTIPGNIVRYYRENEHPLYSTMTEQEVSIYDYLLGKGDAAGAQKYLEFLNEDLRRREGEAKAQEIQDIENPVKRTLATGAHAFKAGVDNAMQGTVQFFRDEEMPTSATQFASAALMEDMGTWGRYAYSAVNTVGNMLPSIVVGTLTGGAGGAAAMGLSSSGNAYKQALTEGYDKSDARAYSVLVGASEAALQYAIGGISKLGGVADDVLLAKAAKLDKAYKRMLATGAIKLGSEITEEEVQLFLEPAIKSIIMDVPYDAPNFEEMVETAIVTALSTGTLEGGNILAAGVNRPVQSVQTENTASETETAGNTMLTDGDLEEYLQVGERQHVRNAKSAQIESGQSPILTTLEQVKSFIRDSLSGKKSETIKGYGRVGGRFRNDVLKQSNGNIDLSGYYLELDSNRLKHLSDHIKDDGDPRNIPLTEEQALSLTEYIDTYDDIISADVKKDGGKRITLGKRINGHAVVVVLASKGRSSVQPVTAWQNTTEHYLAKYKNEQGQIDTSQSPVLSDRDHVDINPTLSEDSIPGNRGIVNSGAAQGFGENGTKVVAEIAQNSGTTVQQVQNRVGLAYQTGRSNLPGTQLDLTDIDQQRAYNAGQMDYLTENPGTKDLVTGQKEGYTDIKTEVPSDGAEEVHLRGSGQRADGTNPGGAVSAVESRTGGNQVRQEQGRPADPEAASLTYGEAVSTASLGIGKGSEDATVRVVTGGDTADTRAAKQLAKERGLRLTLFVGGNLSINGESVRAYITGDRAFVRADHPDFTSAQLMRHEAGHDMIAKGEIDPKTVRERIAERFDGEQLDRVTQMYIEAYAGSGLTVKEIWNEIICDSLGDMNIFSETASEDAAWELLTATKAASADAKAETSRGPPVGEGKMSRDLDERRRALRKGEMVNEFRDKVNWRNYYQKIISDEYNPDYFDDGDIARMPLDGVILKMKMLRNGEWSVVGIEEDVVYGGSKKDSGRADSPDAGTELSEERGTDGDLLNQNSGESGADGARNQTFDRSGADTQRGREGNPTDYSGAGLTEGEASIELERPKVERAAETYTKLFKQCQEMTPAQIVRLTEQDADTTPELTRPEPSGINADTGKESKLYSSAEKSENVANETWGLIQSVDDIKYYQGISNMDTLNRASERLATNGQAETLRFATLDPKEATAVDVAEGFILLKRYQDKGDYESAVTVLHKLREIGTTSGQAVQSFSLLGRLTPEGMAVYAQKELDQARKEMVRKKSEEWVDKRRAQFELTPEEVQFIMDTMERAAELPEGRDKNILIARIATMIEDKIPTTILKQIKGFTRNAMLLNTKTMMRNVVGNAIMMPAYVVQDFIAAGVDASIAKRTGVRTTGTTLPNKAALRAAKRGVYESFDDFRREVNTRQTSGDRFEVGGGPAFKRYSDGEMQEAGRARRLAMELSNALNKVDRVTGWLLDMGDRPFFEYHFTNSLNNQLRLNQTTQPTAEMIDIATTEALRRTWQDDNAYTKAVTTLRNTLNGGKDWGVGSAITTFVKTPANLTKALLEYSPLGLVGVLKNRAGIYTRSKKSKNFDPRTQKAFVDALSKSITGTLVMALGGLLAHVDLISGGDDEEDKDVAAFKQNVMGIAPYSVKIGGKSYTYDWAQPVGGLFAISADFVTNIKNGNEPAVTGLDILGDAGKAIMNALAAGGNVLFEQSFLQGVADLFADDGLVSGLISALSGASGQFVPTALSQIAQLADPYARTSFAYRDIPRTTVNKVIAKTPGLRSTLPAVVDVLGHDVLSYGGNNSVWNVFFNPANVYSETATKAAKEIYRVYEETGDTTIIPRKAPYYLEYKGERYNFTGEERADYQRAMGGTNEQVVGQLLESRLYKRLTDEKKATVLYEITNYSAAVAKKQFLAGKQIEYEGSSWKPWMEHAQNALAMGVSAADYIILHLKKDELESKKGQYKDKNGNTKDYAESYLIMDMVYKSGAATGLTKTQRKKLFEALGVAKAVSDKEKENVEDELNNLKTSAA